LHFAVHWHTAAELIMGRANYKKNYLSEKEIKSLNRIVTMYLDYAEDQTENGIPVTHVHIYVGSLNTVSNKKTNRV
jgi:hypothetical protein